jgi:hypothetical protein
VLASDALDFVRYFAVSGNAFQGKKPLLLESFNVRRVIAGLLQQVRSQA